MTAKRPSGKRPAAASSGFGTGAGTPPTSGAARLKASARRLSRFLRAQVDDPTLDGPQPLTEWDQHTDDRLRAVEQQLANQNRLLVLTFVTILADAMAKLLTAK